MKPKLIITLPSETTANYLRLTGQQATAEVEECVEPSGASLTIMIGPEHYGHYAFLGNEELGEVQVDLTGDDK